MMAPTCDNYYYGVRFARKDKYTEKLIPWMLIFSRGISNLDFRPLKSEAFAFLLIIFFGLI